MLKQQYINSIFLSIGGIILGLAFCLTDASKIIDLIMTIIGIFVIYLGLINLFSLKVLSTDKERNNAIIISIILFVVAFLLMFFHNTIVSIIAGIFLLAIPIYKIIISYNKKQTLNKEIFKILLGIVLVFCGVGTLTSIIFIIVGITLILLSLAYFTYNTIIYIKLVKKIKKDNESKEVIDV